MQRGIHVVLGIKEAIETGLSRCDTKQLALGWAVFGALPLYRGDIGREGFGLEGE